MSSAPFFHQTSPFWQFVSSLDPNNAENNNNTNNASSSRQPREVEINMDFENNPLAFLFGGGLRPGRGGPDPHHPPPHSPHGRRGPRGPGDAPPPPPPPGASHPGPPPPPPAPPAVPPFHDFPHRHRHDRHRGEESGPSGDESRHRHRGRHSDDESDSPRGPPRRGGPGRGGPWSGRGGRHGHGGPPDWLQGLQGLDMSQLGEFIQAQLAAAMPNNGNNATARATDGNTTAPKDSTHDFVPPVDVFDTETSYVVHVSLAGAKKEDLSVNWDAEKSELVVAGVVYRPGDEALLKTLALDERKIGAFERRVALGSKEKKTEVEIEGVSAKMEDGVLVVMLPKKEGEWEKLFVVDVD